MNEFLAYKVLAPIHHYFHYIQFNLLANKLKSLQAAFPITIAIIFTIARVKYMCVETVCPIPSAHYSWVQL